MRQIPRRCRSARRRLPIAAGARFAVLGDMNADAFLSDSVGNAIRHLPDNQAVADRRRPAARDKPRRKAAPTRRTGAIWPFDTADAADAAPGGRACSGLGPTTRFPSHGHFRSRVAELLAICNHSLV